ncbi:MAG: hypothetical protein NT027_01770 [Proteobacteria bacterium]|nr:hypothetical protein [Pseudomonadota bacterium]
MNQILLKAVVSHFALIGFTFEGIAATSTKSSVSSSNRTQFESLDRIQCIDDTKSPKHIINVRLIDIGDKEANVDIERGSKSDHFSKSNVAFGFTPNGLWVEWASTLQDNLNVQIVISNDVLSNTIGTGSVIHEGDEYSISCRLDPFARPDSIESKLVDISWNILPICNSVLFNNTHSGDCTFAATIYKTPARVWSEFRTSSGLDPLRSNIEIKLALKECLFTHFAYSDYSDIQKTFLADKYLYSIRETLPKAQFYAAPRRWQNESVEAFKNEILSSANIGGPECQLVIKDPTLGSFLAISSDVQD